MAKQKYLINVKTGNKFIYTPELAEAKDMAVCDETGRIIPGEAPVVKAPSAGGQPDNQPPAGENETPTLDDFKATVAGMNLDQLKEKAAEIGVEFAPNIGEAKLRERILAEVEKRLAGSGE